MALDEQSAAIDLTEEPNASVISTPQLPRAATTPHLPAHVTMEFVFVLHRFELFPESAPHGLAFFEEGGFPQGISDGLESQQRVASKGVSPEAEKGWNVANFGRLVREKGFFVERDYAERTPSFKQVIPYTVVRRASDGHVLVLQRTKKGGEARLHQKLSIGVGGHVNPIDAMGIEPEDAGGSPRRVLDPLPAATRREVMEEELTVTGATRLTQIGLLNDDTNAVGAVHVGLVQVLDLVDGDAQVREVDQLHGEFVSVSELVARFEKGANFETWSQLLIQELGPILETADRSGATASTATDPNHTALLASTTH